MYVGICKYYPILYEGHEHPWILVFVGGDVPRTNLLLPFPSLHPPSPLATLDIKGILW